MTDQTPKPATAGRILVVDDQEPMREITGSILATAEYECLKAASGPEALALLESGEKFDLMLTDVMMPEMDGITLLERTKDKYPDMTVVIMSTVHDGSVVLAAIRSGAYDYLLMPFAREALLDMVRRALDDRSAKLERRAYVSRLEQKVASLTDQLRERR